MRMTLDSRMDLNALDSRTRREQRTILFLSSVEACLQFPRHRRISWLLGAHRHTMFVKTSNPATHLLQKDKKTI